MSRKIVTYHIYPPIPTAKFDWWAFYDGEEKAGCYGYGATEEEAIADFIENWAEYHDDRLDARAKLDAIIIERCEHEDPYGYSRGRY